MTAPSNISRPSEKPLDVSHMKPLGIRAVIAAAFALRKPKVVKSLGPIHGTD